MASLLSGNYDSSGDDEKTSSHQAPPSRAAVDAAPDVPIEDQSHVGLVLADSSSNALTYNARYDDLARPSLGPANPYRDESIRLKRKNVLTGQAEETMLSHKTFDSAQRTFQNLGYTRDPGAPNSIIGNTDNATAYGGLEASQIRPAKDESAKLRRKRQKFGDAAVLEGDEAFKGPWARYDKDDVLYEDEVASDGRELATDEEFVEEEESTTGPMDPMDKKATAYAEDDETRETTEFHGREQYDYLGRTYMHVPQDLDVDLTKDPGDVKNYIPKRLVHTWKSHTKPITSLRFIPNSGHLLLSSSADGKVKLYDVYHSRELLRTYSGHSKSVADTDFNYNGTQFISGSYDRQIKLWDTEYGKCINRFSTGKTPHVVRFNPDPDTSHEILAGMSDKKIVQFDTRTGQIAQEYDYHLAPVNTITFVDNNRRFISTSDDKSLRAWEYNIPVQIKCIVEPHMYPLVSAAPHPNGKFVAFQSGDNQIVVYSSTDKFRQNRKKNFRGHNNAGYAIDLKISPDGQFLMSGDSGGYVCFWDWKTCKMFHKIQAGGKEGAATTCLDWHPQETSKVATGGLEGTIKYWD